jgi:hypothetical protein
MMGCPVMYVMEIAAPTCIEIGRLKIARQEARGEARQELR